MRSAACGLALSAMACSSAMQPRPTAPEQYPGVVFPTTLAEGSSSNAAASPARAPASAAAPPPKRDSAPDPEPLSTRKQWQYRLHWKSGKLEVESVEPKTFDTAQITPRRFGRFAIELWIGQELLDRVRFDFPLLAGEDPTRNLPGARPGVAAKADVRQTVLVPDSERARRAVLVDREQGTQIALPWPPDAPLTPLEPE